MRSVFTRADHSKAAEGSAALTRAGLWYVSCVIAAGAVTLLWRFPQSVPDIGLFIGLLLASSLASSHRLRLPLGANSSTLSVSYATDFASLFLIGTDLTMVVAATSAFVQIHAGRAARTDQEEPADPRRLQRRRAGPDGSGRGGGGARASGRRGRCR